MASRDFQKRLVGYGLTTANILYRRPDYPWLLQTFVWQAYDLCPAFPELQRFLDFWSRSLDGDVHSVMVAHSNLIKPAELRAIDGVFRLHWWAAEPQLELFVVPRRRPIDRPDYCDSRSGQKLIPYGEQQPPRDTVCNPTNFHTPSLKRELGFATSDRPARRGGTKLSARRGETARRHFT
jgi:uncharacterized protein Usg